MSKTVNLRTAIQKILKDVLGEDVTLFYEHGYKSTSFPYVVYAIEFMGIDYQLEINVYDKAYSTIDIETITDKLDDFFRHLTYIDENQHFTTYINTRNNLDDESDKTMKRRRLLVDLTLFWKEM